jgi:peptide subunit release factor 1 (eRF1)
MSLADTLANLPHLPPPVLTAYLDTNPSNPRNQGARRGYVTWLKTAARNLRNELPKEAGKTFRAQLNRIQDYLQTERPGARGLVVFAGPKVWQVAPLQVEVAEELHWGKPSLQQMMWVLDEHRPRGAIVIDGAGARFFRFWLGKVTEDEAAAFHVDYSSWRRPHLVGPSTSAVSKQHGVQRDRVAHRAEAQRDRFSRALRARIERWAAEEQVSPFVLVGDATETEALIESMPATLRTQVATLSKSLPHISASNAKAKLAPLLRRWERDHEATLVEDLISSQGARRAVTGLDETLALLQEGRVRQLVVSRGLSGLLRECLKCGRMDRSADPVCASCGGDRRSRSIRTVIPELASQQEVPVEVVSGDAAKKLRAAGGVGAWLRRSSAPPRDAPGKGRARSPRAH